MAGYDDSSVPEWARVNPNLAAPAQGTAQFYPDGALSPTPRQAVPALLMPQLPPIASPLSVSGYRPFTAPNATSFAAPPPTPIQHQVGDILPLRVPAPPTTIPAPMQNMAAVGRGGLWAGLAGLLAGGLIGRGRGALSASTGAMEGYQSGADGTQTARLQNWQAQNQAAQDDYRSRLQTFNAQNALWAAQAQQRAYQEQIDAIRSAAAGAQTAGTPQTTQSTFGPRDSAPASGNANGSLRTPVTQGPGQPNIGSSGLVKPGNAAPHPQGSRPLPKFAPQVDRLPGALLADTPDATMGLDPIEYAIRRALGTLPPVVSTGELGASAAGATGAGPGAYRTRGGLTYTING